MVEPHHIDRAYTLMLILDGIRHAFRKGFVPEMMALGGMLRFPDPGPGCLLSNRTRAITCLRCQMACVNDRPSMHLCVFGHM